MLSISFDSFEPERQFNLGEIFTAPPATEIIGWREVLEADEEKPLRALVVDDEETVLATIADAVECCGAEVTTARSGNEAIAKLQTSYFDIVFTDLMMPGMSGFELITIAKEIAPQTEIHVITAYGSIENAVEATKRGAAGFVVKPDILTAIKEAIDKFGDQNHREETEGERNAGGGVLGSMAQVAVARVRDTKQLKRLAYTDPLTSLFNRTMFQFFLRNECSRCARHEGAFAVMVVDVDHFKRYNDANGLLMGDLALSRIADLIRCGVRASDIPARYGGDEFVVIVTHVSLNDAIQVACRIGKSIYEADIEGQENSPGGNLTVSVGLAMCPDHGANPRGVFHAADTARKRAKAAGGNRVCIFQKGMDDDRPENPPRVSIVK